jgi:signal transduction histidine kinase
VVGLVGYLIPGLTETQLAWYNDNFAYFLIATILAVASAFRSRSATGLEERRMWRWLAIAELCWACSDLGESFIPAMRQLDIAGLPSTIFYILAYGAWLFATVEAPHRRSGWTTGHRGWTLERWGVAVFGLAVTADLVIVPQLAAPDSPLHIGLSSAVFMAFDAAFFARLAGLGLRVTEPAWRRWYGYMALVALMMFACDLAATLILFDRVGPWNGPIYDLLWYAPMLLMAYTASLPTPQPVLEERRAGSFAEQAAAEGSVSLESLLAVLTPAYVFIHLVAGMTTLVPAAAAGWRALSAIGFLILMGVLLVRRQLGLERQVHRLGHELAHATAALADRRRLDAIARLAGGVAHNFNNLLTVIMGHGELLRGRLGPQEEGNEDVGRIQEAAQRAARLTANLLAFGAQQPIDPRPLDLNALLDGTTAELRLLAGTGVRLHAQHGTALPSVTGDRALLREALRQLVDHARLRLGGAGSITIATASLDLTAAPSPGSLVPAGRYLRLSVEDDGPPLNADEQEQLFEPFSGPVAEELRLGMAAVRGIVQRHGGYILVHTSPRQGLRFDLLLPAAPEAALR